MYAVEGFHTAHHKQLPQTGRSQAHRWPLFHHLPQVPKQLPGPDTRVATLGREWIKGAPKGEKVGNCPPNLPGMQLVIQA